jgi:hypothetical protein
MAGMRIKLYSYAVVASGLTWEQVDEAEAKANVSEAAKQFRFHRHAFEPKAHPVKCWSLLATPRIYYETTFGGGNDSGWWIEVADVP